MKKLLSIPAAVVMALSLLMTAQAGMWMKDDSGWRYGNGDGTFQNSGWFEDADGKYYYFNADGYMLKNTITPDGHYVDPNGVWVEKKALRSVSGAYDSKRAYRYGGADNMMTELPEETFLLKLEEARGDGSVLNFSISEVNQGILPKISGKVREDVNPNHAQGREYLPVTIGVQRKNTNDRDYSIMKYFSVQDSLIKVSIEYYENGAYYTEVLEFPK